MAGSFGLLAFISVVLFGTTVSFAYLYIAAKKDIGRQRKDAIKQSLAVTIGKVTEHMAPYLADFKFNPKDARFLGSPIDLIVFDGLSGDEVKEIVFIEIKTGSSVLTSQKRLVRNAVEDRRVKWVEIKHLAG